MKKALFPLETRFFSFSIRNATGDASFSLVTVQPKKEINHGNCKEGSGQESSGKEGRSRQEGCGSCKEGRTGQEGSSRKEGCSLRRRLHRRRRLLQRRPLPPRSARPTPRS
ncbi:hypothetical protein M0765_018845 [Variovorax sp. S2]|uniref:hypothetical protein n=1 Tax=Variovorax sp. S12S4 TaxID=3029170 RepID=UPI00215D5B92|nr:hypothetical protein [Variovorax sp. S12S4]MCR8959722.1 hypothetical protein [Variovorax sp. S12S4]